MSYKQLSALVIASIVLSGCATLPPPPAITTMDPEEGESPVQFDTPNAHVIVMRPIDSWSPDEGASEDSLIAAMENESGFYLLDDTGINWPGHSNVLFQTTKHPIIIGVERELAKKGRRLVYNNDYLFQVNAPVSFNPESYPSFVELQKLMLVLQTRELGNPDKQSGSVFARKVMSNALAVVAVAGVANAHKTLGAATTLDGAKIGLNTVANATHDLIGAKEQAAANPLFLPSFDANGYTEMEVRRVTQGAEMRMGQIVIFYKTAKTSESEKEALVPAIVSLLGSDTSVEAIQRSRAKDLERRRTIWKACVSEGQCKE